MYQLYWRAGTASFAPHAVLQETGQEYRIIPVEQDGDQPKDKSYLRINPSGKVPALVKPDGQIVTESAAICLYLADRHSDAALAPGYDDAKRAAYYQWFCYLTNTVQPAWLEYYYPHRHTTDTAASAIASVKEKAAQNLTVQWRYIEDHLRDQGPFLLGDRVSACDIYLLMMASWTDQASIFQQNHPCVIRAAAAIMARPAIEAILAQHDMAA